MTYEFALDYIPRRMRELGFGDCYSTRLRQIQLDASSTFVIDADNEFFIFIEGDPNLTIKSKFGTYDVNDTLLNELQHEHRGKISVVNPNDVSAMVTFIQVIPHHQKK
jgi:hypothetical protein